jgi:DNA-directed RNA polymerase subunit RPC12/RpoP
VKEAMSVPYYVVNAGRGQSTHIIKAKRPSGPNPQSPESITAQAVLSGGKPNVTLCGLQATAYVNMSNPDEVSCPECRRRWHLAAAAEAAAQRPLAGLTVEQSEVQLRRAPKARMVFPALMPGKVAKPGRCPRCGRRVAGVWLGKRWTDGAHLSADGTGYCPGP